MLTLKIPVIPKPPPPAEEPPVLEMPALKPVLSARRFPRGLTTLAVSWLHGRFEAVAIQRGDVTGTFEAPRSSDDPAHFAELLKEAVSRTGYRGTLATLLLAHPRLTHQLIETPPARGAALDALVSRQVERMKVFDAEAAWAYQSTLPTKNSCGVLVHLFPRPLLDQFVDAAERAGVRLVGVTPCTAVLQNMASRLPSKPDEVTMVAAETAGMMTVVVGRKDGQPLLARSLDAGRSNGAAAIAVDLNRTLLFVSQQFGTGVGTVWLFGTGAASRLTELQASVQVPVRLSPEPDRPFFWSEEAALLGAGQAPNLITTEQRKAPQRRVLARVALFIGAIVATVAALTVGFCETLNRRERTAIREFEQRLNQLKAQHQDLQRTHLELQRKSQVSRVVLDDRVAPVPALFLGYLSEATPPEIVLTNLEVERKDDRWMVRLSGVRQSVSDTNPPTAQAIAVFVERLRTGPFHMDLDSRAAEPTSSSPAPLSGIESIASWAARFTSIKAPQPAAPSDHFTMEGVMR